MKDYKNFTVFSSEHAGNSIPSFLKGKVFIPDKVLNSHRGLDVGVFYLSEIAEEILQVPVFKFEISRLIIEGNRPLRDPGLFSTYMKKISDQEKKKLIVDFHKPHWREVEKRVKAKINKSGRCIHLAIHSFTPVFRGNKREFDIGLLFDPKNSLEKKVCKLLQKEFQKIGFTVRLNKPYKGTDPGMTQSFRQKLKNYAGIELEVNQKIFRQKNFSKKSVHICETMKKCLTQILL